MLPYTLLVLKDIFQSINGYVLLCIFEIPLSKSFLNRINIIKIIIYFKLEILRHSSFTCYIFKWYKNNFSSIYSQSSYITFVLFLKVFAHHLNIFISLFTFLSVNQHYLLIFWPVLCTEYFEVSEIIHPCKGIATPCTEEMERGEKSLTIALTMY